MFFFLSKLTFLFESNVWINAELALAGKLVIKKQECNSLSSLLRAKIREIFKRLAWLLSKWARSQGCVRDVMYLNDFLTTMAHTLDSVLDNEGLRLIVITTFSGSFAPWCRLKQEPEERKNEALREWRQPVLRVFVRRVLQRKISLTKRRKRKVRFFGKKNRRRISSSSGRTERRF